MTMFLVAAAVVPLAPALIVWALMLKLRHRGRPDTAGERVLVTYLAYCVARAAVMFLWPYPPRWVVIAMPVPLLIVCGGFLYLRIRQHPEAIFSPATVRRLRSCKGHR